ncbi:uncharacterized protein LOC110740484 [Papio anubis]|uniref:uncharacterized protein LOC110740484 n=1 Tax=Papio anubis TaxID=9555 RepID=UPI0012AD9487|nr:uncharacterized protein LOC110740484 [Papio anubis]
MQGSGADDVGHQKPNGNDGSPRGECGGIWLPHSPRHLCSVSLVWAAVLEGSCGSGPWACSCRFLGPVCLCSSHGIHIWGRCLRQGHDCPCLEKLWVQSFHSLQLRNVFEVLRAGWGGTGDARDSLLGTVPRQSLLCLRSPPSRRRPLRPYWGPLLLLARAPHLSQWGLCRPPGLCSVPPPGLCSVSATCPVPPTGLALAGSWGPDRTISLTERAVRWGVRQHREVGDWPALGVAGPEQGLQAEALAGPRPRWGGGEGSRRCGVWAGTSVELDVQWKPGVSRPGRPHGGGAAGGLCTEATGCPRPLFRCSYWRLPPPLCLRAAPLWPALPHD